MRSIRLLAVLLVPVVALILGAAAPEVWAQDDEVECFFNIEFNATDLDVGVRGFFDFEPYDELEIEDPDGRTIGEVEAKRSLALQGIAEFFFESGEPNLEDLSLAEFLDRFEEGEYEYEAEPIEGGEVECEAEFTHVIPCGPEISLTGNTIRWDPVTTVVDPDQTDENGVVCVAPGELGQELIIDGYEVVAEGENGEFTINLPSTATSVLVPPQLGDIEKYEVLVIEESGNQSITEVEL